MTILADIAKLLLDDHRGHYLAGVDRGILRAKSGRPLEHLGADEIEILTDIITEVIHKEWARAVADEQARSCNKLAVVEGEHGRSNYAEIWQEAAEIARGRS